MPKPALPKKSQVIFDIIQDTDGNVYHRVSTSNDAAPALKIKRVPAQHTPPHKQESDKLSRKRKNIDAVPEDELLTEDQLKQATEDAERKEYLRAKRICKAYERKVAAAKLEKLSPVESADRKLTKAASILMRWKSLNSAPMVNQQLAKAVPVLRRKGETLFDEAHDIIAKLTEEEKIRFWELQVRNKDAKGFDELMTKKDYHEVSVSEEDNARTKDSHETSCNETPLPSTEPPPPVPLTETISNSEVALAVTDAQ